VSNRKDELREKIEFQVAMAMNSQLEIEKSTPVSIRTAEWQDRTHKLRKDITAQILQAIKEAGMVMLAESGDPTYTLTCDNCGQSYLSQIAFPAHQLCPACKKGTPKQDERLPKEKINDIAEIVAEIWRSGKETSREGWVARLVGIFLAQLAKADPIIRAEERREIFNLLEGYRTGDNEKGMLYTIPFHVWKEFREALKQGRR